MYETFVDWLLGLPQAFAQFGAWLTTPIADSFPVAPLALFSVGAIGIVIVWKAIRLFVGG